MRLHHILILAAAAILASADAGLATAEGKLVAAGQNNVPAKRILRADTKIADDEERAFINIQLPKSLTNFFKGGTASKDDQLVQMLKQGDSADQALEALKLTGNVGNLLTNPNLNRFATYIEMLNVANMKAGKPTVTMIETLTKSHGTPAIATMITNAKQVDRTSKLATSLEAALISTWRLEKKSSNDVFNLLEITGIHHPNKAIWTAYKASMKASIKAPTAARV